MPPKDHLTPHQQRASFAQAFDTVQHYLTNDNFIAAYVVAFSILEDRIGALYTGSLQEKPVRGKAKRGRHQPMGEKLQLLVRRQVITTTEKTTWLAIANARNQKLHAAMWHLDAFTADDVDAVLAAAQRASNLRKQQKRAQARKEQV